MRFRGSPAFIMMAAVAGLVVLAPAHAVQKTATMHGYVLDSACLLVKNVKKPNNAGKCALECTKAGSPLAILADDGTTY
jgi:hypothetical protein